MGYYIDLKSISIDTYKNMLKTTHLIPSWKVLENDIDKNLDIIKKHGAKTLDALLITLKGKDKIQEFSKKSRLPENYLTVLKRVVKGYRPKPNRLKDFTCIAKDTVAKLEALGLKNTFKLYEEVLTAEKRKALSMKSGISMAEILKLTKLTDLSRIRWVNHTFAYVLLEAKYDTPEKVANANCQKLYEDVKKLNAKRQIYNAHIGTNDMKMIIDFAKGLDFEIEYQRNDT